MVTTWDVWPRSLWSVLLCRFCKRSLRMRLWAEFPCVSTYPKRPRWKQTLQFMSQFGGLWKRQNNPACTESVRVFHIIEDVPLVEFIYLVFTRMPGESYRRRLKSLLLCSCDVFRAIINSLMCWFYQIITETGLCTEEEEDIGHFQIIIEIGHYTEEEEEKRYRPSPNNYWNRILHWRRRRRRRRYRSSPNNYWNCTL